MLIESPQVIVYASSWLQTALLGALGTAFGSLLIWIGLRLVTKVDAFQVQVEGIKKDLTDNYRRKEDCKHCDPTTAVVKNLSTDVEQLVTDLAALKKLTGPETLVASHSNS